VDVVVVEVVVVEVDVEEVDVVVEVVVSWLVKFQPSLFVLSRLWSAFHVAPPVALELLISR
jgi:hypothetical protein